MLCTYCSDDPFSFRFPFPFSVSVFRFHFPFPPFTVLPMTGVQPCSKMTGIFLMSDFNISKIVTQLHLPTLISRKQTDSKMSQDANMIWERLPDIPYFALSLFAIGDQVFAAGGRRDGLLSMMAEAYLVKSSKTDESG